jgi:hypothetical protein
MGVYLLKWPAAWSPAQRCQTQASRSVEEPESLHRYHASNYLVLVLRKGCHCFEGETRSGFPQVYARIREGSDAL